MKPGLVSVIIPTHNRATLVVRAIASALAQSYRTIEVLVIDDGSTDDTSARVQMSSGRDTRVRYLPQPNGGVSSARNLGLREAQGEFIAFLDADDTWLPGKLELQLNALACLPEAGMIWTDMSAMHPDGSVAHDRYLRKMYDTYRYFPTVQSLFAKDYKHHSVNGIDIYCGDIFSPMVLGNVVHTSTVLMRRERLNQTGFFDEALKTGEDYPFHLRTCKAGLVAYADTVTIRYAIDLPDALTSTEKRIHLSLSFLETLQTTLASEKDRIALSPQVIRKRLSDAFGWAGYEAQVAGQFRRSRTFYYKSLQSNPRNVSSIKGLVKAFLPTNVRNWITDLKRRVS